MSGPRKHHSGAQKIKCTFLKHDRVSELIKKTPKLRNYFSAATNPPASQPSAAATSTTMGQITAFVCSQSASALTSSTSSAGTTDADQEEPEPGSSQSQVGRDEPEDLDSADAEAVVEKEISREKLMRRCDSYWVGKGVMAPTLCQSKDEDFSGSERMCKSQK